jgi:hypothetical protein
MQNWIIFCAWANHWHTQIHKTHYNSNLGEVTTLALAVFFAPGHEGCTQMSFCPKTPKSRVLKLPKLRILKLWRPITFHADLWLRWSPKQSCTPCQDLSNDMWHTTCSHVFNGWESNFVVNLGLGLQRWGPRVKPRVTFHAPENVKEFEEMNPTLPSELLPWELDSQWTFKFSKGNCRGQNSWDWKAPYINEEILELRCLKWAHMTHLDT